MKHLACLLFLLGSFFAMHLSAQNRADMLAEASQQARAAGNIDEAIKLNDEEIALRRKDTRNSKLFLANSLHTQAINYSAIGGYDNAIAMEEEALEIFRRLDRKEQYLGVSLNNLAAYHFSRAQSGDYAKAEAYAEEGLTYEKKGTENYVTLANHLVVYHTMAGHSTQANLLSKSLLKQGKKVYGLNTIHYADILSNQSVKLANIGNLSEAISYAEESTIIYEDSGDTLNISFARLLMNTANYYTSREDYQTSVHKLERARAILREVEGESGMNYINCIGELSSAYNHLGDLQKADDLASATHTSTDAKADEKTTLIKAQAMKKQAEVFANNGNYPVAIGLQKGVLDIYTLYADSLGMAGAYNTLSNYYYHNEETDKAIECCQQSIDIYSRNQGEKTDMAQAFNSMSIYYYHANDYEAARQFATESVKMYEEAGDSTSSFYAKALANAALYHYATGDTETAIEDALRSYRLQTKVLGDGHPDNVTSLFNIAQYYYAKGDDAKLHEYYHQATQLQSGLVRSNFSHMTTVGREMYWNTKKFVYAIAPTYAYLCEDNDSLLLDVYNSQLFTKGILLNSEIDFKALLMQSGDSILLGKYMELTDLHNQIAELYNTSAGDERAITSAGEVESLQRKATQLERELMRSSKEYGDYTANMNLTARDIASSLQEGDVAMELFEIAVEGGKAYYALYLKKDWKVPRIVKMFSHLDLKSITHNGKDFYQMSTDKEGLNYIFSEGDIGQMVWNPLIQSWGDDVKNVYFSPSGLFYQWGIEYLLLGDGQRIGDKYNIYRLSSTKLLAQGMERHPLRNASLFGGFDYDLPVELMAELHNGVGKYTNELVTVSDNEDVAMERSLFDTDNTVADSLALRGSVGSLQGALKEVESIGSQLMQHEIKTDLFTHELGIEENFKALSGKPHSLVHIATHGFSLGEDNTTRMKLASVLGNSWTLSASDANLNYSGLLFAGANNALNGRSVPQGVENGILTSREISMLDLRGTDMVVLSACQTGLGDIKEDGVFGLQRGFKKAGAQTLLMSLWSVDDYATQLMMTHFYTCLINGASRHDAFKQAQEKVRSSGFSAPFYWASFIMLDDL